MKSFYIWITVAENWGDDERLGILISKLIDGGFDVKKINKELDQLAFIGGNYIHCHFFHFRIIVEEDSTPGAIRHIVEQIMESSDINGLTIVVTDGDINASWSLVDEQTGSVKGVAEYMPGHCNICSATIPSHLTTCQHCREALGYSEKYVQCETCRIEIKNGMPGYCRNCHNSLVEIAQKEHNEICKNNHGDIISEIAEKQARKELEIKAKIEEDRKNQNKALSSAVTNFSTLGDLIKLVKGSIELSDFFFEMSKESREQILNELLSLQGGDSQTN